MTALGVQKRKGVAIFMPGEITDVERIGEIRVVDHLPLPIIALAEQHRPRMIEAVTRFGVRDRQQIRMDRIIGR